ncbi:prefoldin subunit alpha [Candidatus Woesearchaeota archaeon]|nr:prefoldin subunit alpha [Candidatus Woesearchaeota archaeon]
MVKDKKDQEDYIQLQILTQQLQQYQNNLEIIDHNLTELKRLELSLDDFEKVKKQSVIMVPIGQNIFTKARLEDEKDLLVAVGSSVLVKKSVAETKEFMKKQEDELVLIFNQLREEMQNIYLYIQQIQNKEQPNEDHASVG